VARNGLFQATLARKASSAASIASEFPHASTRHPAAGEQAALLVGAIEHLCQREFTGWRIGEQGGDMIATPA